MAKNRWAVLAGAFVLLLVSRWAFAHHSLSIYGGQITLTGTASEFVFSNPHAVIKFEVRDASGNVETWTAETSGPRRLATAGWDQNTVKPGDPITAIGRPAKDGSKKMFMERIIVNGKEYGRGRR